MAGPSAWIYLALAGAIVGLSLLGWVTLAVGTDEDYTGSYVITQADMDTNGGGDGDIDNGADPITGKRGKATDRLEVEPHALVFSYEHQVMAVPT